jgi:hypothetical protein
MIDEITKNLQQQIKHDLNFPVKYGPLTKSNTVHYIFVNFVMFVCVCVIPLGLDLLHTIAVL